MLTGSAAAVLIVFGDSVLRLWTRNSALSQRVAPLMAVLALGALLNGLMWIPYQMQLAHGWTSLTVRVNTVAVCLLVPAICLVVPAYGALGAAWAWVTLNAGYLTLGIPLMHQRLLRSEKWSWYRNDVACPLAAAGVTALLFRWMMPHGLGRLTELAALAIISGCVLTAAAMTTPTVRSQLTRYMRAV